MQLTALEASAFGRKNRFLIVLGMLEAAYMGLIWSIQDIAHFGMSGLFITAAGLVLWEGPAHRQTRASRPEAAAGAVLLTAVALSIPWLWVQGLSSAEQHPLRLIPFAALFAGLLAFRGWAGVRGQTMALAILFFLGGPHLLMWWLEVPRLLAEWGAKWAGFLLWYTGTAVVSDGPKLFLEGGGILVTPECAGSDILTYLLGIAFIALTLYPLPRRRYALVLGAAVLIAFLVNVIRIALLAVLNSYAEKDLFHYWHTSEGAQVFGVVALALFAAFYLILGRMMRKQADPGSDTGHPGF